MSNITRYSMRPRTRGSTNASNDNADNTAAASSVAASRTALGNISNREGNDEHDKERTSKRLKPSAVVARVRRGTRSQSSKAKEQEPELESEKKPTTRRTSTRSRKLLSKGAAGKSAADKKTTTKKEVAAKKKAVAKKEPTKERGGVKRTSTDGNNPKPSGRTSKRAKKSEVNVAKVKTAVSQRSTRSRSRSVAPRGSAKKKSTTRGRNVVVKIVSADNNRVVPHNFGLKRDSFNGKNFTHGIAHYDASDRSDPLLCKDYVTDMFQYYFDAETTAHPTPYMDRQEDINAKMRAILVDWLVEVHTKFRLVPETLYLCVHIIDRYCSIVDVARSKLQLVGVTALFLACKHEEIYPPEVRDCVYITDRAYDRQEVLDMEQTLLRVLDWRISLPTAYPFLDRFLSLTNASPMTRHAAMYYLERTLQEHDLLAYRPSLVCASVVILALNNPDIRIHEEEYQRELPGLPKMLMEYTEFEKDKLMDCMTVIAAKISEPAICASRRHLTAVKKKYEHRKYLSVSSMLEHPSISFVRKNMTE